jgi:hypothetical protein
MSAHEHARVRSHLAPFADTPDPHRRVVNVVEGKARTARVRRMRSIQHMPLGSFILRPFVFFAFLQQKEIARILVVAKSDTSDCDMRAEPRKNARKRTWLIPPRRKKKLWSIRSRDKLEHV